MRGFLTRPLPEDLDALAELALDLRWTWSHEADQLWKAVNPEVWQQTQNPWAMLQSVPRLELERLAGDGRFMAELGRLIKARQDYVERPGWFREHYPEGTLQPVAYFSMEYGLGEGLPLYAGGLGVLAGDYLKTASDLHVPMVGLGILYQQGYFRQILEHSGWQLEAYPYNVPTSLPISPVIDDAGGWLRIPLELPGQKLWLRVWQARIGSVALYLLDSNDPLNSPANRGITSKLYDDRAEIRLMQEMVLGIGGWRVIRALNIPVEVCHLNEGHTAFVVLERAREFMLQTGESFPVAVCAVRAGNAFTTHTPVAAGFDVFPPDLLRRYLQKYLGQAGIPLREVLALGRTNPEDEQEPFNMAYLAMRGSLHANGVSRLHGEVSRRLFQPLFPRWPEDEVPISHVTNGVHVGSWDSAAADELWTNACGKERWLHALETVAEAIERISDADLWSFRTRQSQALVEYIRQRLALQLEQQGAGEEEIDESARVLDANVLIVGFARRFTAYKRPDLLLTDLRRLKALITNPNRPVQVVAAGKAHPEDEEGKRLVQQFVCFSHDPEVRGRVVYLQDYDIAMAQRLMQGVDLWLNTPRRPWEACGTSGMKVLVNGGLNFSELDGWWAEAHQPDVGWALGDGKEHPEPGWDLVEAQRLYELLEEEIVPTFYRQDERGIPRDWVRRMRASMSRLTADFSTNRMLREYTEGIYIPAAARFRKRLAGGARLAHDVYAFKVKLERYWRHVRFGEVRASDADSRIHFEAAVYLGELDPASVAVEIYADAAGLYGRERIPMARGDRLEGALNGYTYRGEILSGRRLADYTVRVIPAHAEAFVPLEANRITWQK
ncbi:MAG: alpha-glucan family phosphorylase [Chloroflexi bacterium]|nr:alpha-glucan family phosphorylase [Chloroflexota bacterium]